MISRTLLSLTLLALVACSDTKLARIEPFKSIGAVLGMRATELQRARPDARFSEYLGLEERVAPYTVTYAVEGTGTELGAGPVMNISALRIVASDSAQQLFARDITDAAKVLGRPTECGTQFALQPRRAAIWRIADQEIVVSTWTNVDTTFVMKQWKTNQPATTVSPAIACDSVTSEASGI